MPLSMILSVSTTWCFLPCGSSLDAGGVFEIELPMLHRWGTFDRIGKSGETRGNASVFVPEPVKSAGRLRPPHMLLFQGFITTQIREDGAFNLACAPGLLADHPGSLRADLPLAGRV